MTALNLSKQIKNKKGFTLIELLVVIGILAILLAIVLIAINPAKQFGQANDTKRSSDVNAILNALNQYMADNKGVLPPSASPITATASYIGNAAGQIDLCSFLVTKYMADLPVDPTVGTRSYTTGNCTQASASYQTGYMVSVSTSDNRLTVSAPTHYGTAVIQVTR